MADILHAIANVFFAMIGGSAVGIVAICLVMLPGSADIAYRRWMPEPWKKEKMPGWCLLLAHVAGWVAATVWIKLWF